MCQALELTCQSNLTQPFKSHLCNNFPHHMEKILHHSAALSVQEYPSYRWLSTHSFVTSFVDEGDDIPTISGPRQFSKAFARESKKLWYLASPAIFTSLYQYSLGAITQTFAGHVSTLDLAVFSIKNSVIAGLSFGVMLGMGSALETLCGQAYGAGQIEMLGVYMQRSLVILLGSAVILTVLYVFSLPFLLMIGQEENISRSAGKFVVWMIPQLYAYALNFPIAKFLQVQSNIMAMAGISAAALALHVAFSWKYARERVFFRPDRSLETATADNFFLAVDGFCPAPL